jgi:iron complex outermembrane recepter protein
VRLASGQYLGPDATAELSVPVTDSFGIKGAVGYFDDQYPDGASAWFLSYGSVARWKHTKGLEVTALFSRYDYGDEEQGPVIYTSGAFLPQKVKRRRHFGQDWAQWVGHAQNFDGFAKAELGDWRLGQVC